MLGALTLARGAAGTRAGSLAIIPDTITLGSPAARQQLVVERVDAQQLIGQVTNAVRFTSSDTNVARIENDVVVPVRDGTKRSFGPGSAARVQNRKWS